MSAAPAFRVGFVASPHPHAAMHLKTLEVLPEVERVLCAGVGDADGAALAAGLAKAEAAGGVSDLLAPGAVDALVVCVRNDLCPALLEAAGRGRAAGDLREARGLAGRRPAPDRGAGGRRGA